MGRNDTSGEIPSAANGELHEIQQALQVAREMARLTRDGLDSIRQQQIRRHVLSQPDPRLAGSLNQRQSRILSLLTTHFKLRLPDPTGVMNLREAYHRIHQRLSGLGQKSFRMVSHRVANSGSVAGGDTFGYVIPGQNFIYLNETYFSRPQRPQSPRTTNASNPAAGTRTGQVRGTVTVEQAGIRIIYSREKRGSIILHEAVHLCYGAAGAIHRALRSGEDIDTETVNCDTGFPQISNYSAALRDAYVYARFARCIYRSRGTNRGR